MGRCLSLEEFRERFTIQSTRSTRSSSYLVLPPRFVNKIGLASNIKFCNRSTYYITLHFDSVKISLPNSGNSLLPQQYRGPFTYDHLPQAPLSITSQDFHSILKSSPLQEFQPWFIHPLLRFLIYLVQTETYSIYFASLPASGPH